MTFKVCFVHHEEAVGIEHGIHLRLTRIVAGAHGVDVGLLHQGDIAKHGGYVNVASIERMGIVDIRSFEEDALAVDGHIFVCFCIDELDVAEAILCAENHFFLLSVELADNDIVEVRLLCVPGIEVFQQSCCQIKVDAPFRKLHLLLLLCNDFTLGIEEFESIGATAFQTCTIVDVKSYIQSTAFAVSTLTQNGNDVVADKRLGLGHEIDIAMDTAQSPHILTFEVRTVAPAIDADGELVPSGTHGRGDVVFRIVVCTLPIANELAIDPYGGTTIDTVEVDEHSLVSPIGRQVESAAVESRSVVAHDAMFLVAVHSTWWLVLEGVASVVVGGFAVARHLPTYGHGDERPALVVVILGLELACSGALV